MEKENILENQPEKDSNPGMARRIIGIVIMLVLAAFAVLVIFASFLPKNFNPNLNDPTYIKIYPSNSSSQNYGSIYSKNSKEYKKIMQLYNDSFNTTIIGAMVQGKLGEGVTAKEGYKSLSSLSGTYLEFFYNESQKIVLNGNEYEPEIVSNNTYIGVVIEVLNTADLSEINIYFKYRDTGSNNYSYVRFLTYAKQAELYSYIENL